MIGGQTIRTATLLVGLAGGLCACVPATFMDLPMQAPLTDQDRLTYTLARSGFPGTTGSCGVTGELPAVVLPSVSAPSQIPNLKVACELVPLSALARGAWSGDRHAQLELGRRFEEGRGVPKDIKRAEELYERSAETRGGPIGVWVPGVGDARGHIMMVDMPYDYGLPEARKERERIKAELKALRQAAKGRD